MIGFFQLQTAKGACFNSPPYRMLAVMRWPADEAARKAFIRKHQARVIAAKAAGREGAGEEESIIEDVTIEGFEGAYRDARDQELGMVMAGLILRGVFYLRRTDPEGASIERAIQEVERADVRARVGMHRAKLWKFWSTRKTVAHLCATYSEWRSGDSTLDPYQLNKLPAFLRRAEWYRVEAEHYIPLRVAKHSGENARPILTPGESWVLPPDLILDRPYISAALKGSRESTPSPS